MREEDTIKISIRNSGTGGPGKDPVINKAVIVYESKSKSLCDYLNVCRRSEAMGHELVYISTRAQLPLVLKVNSSRLYSLIFLPHLVTSSNVLTSSVKTVLEA